MPTISAYSGADCKDVLVVGDSMANTVGPVLESELEATGRCAQVVNRSVSGSAIAEWAPGGYRDINTVLDAGDFDIVLIQLIGNEGSSGAPMWSDPNWLEATENATLAIIDAVLARGLRVYWTVPPKSTWNCKWGDAIDQRWTALHHWMQTLPSVRALQLVDSRTLFGGEVFSRSFRFPDGSVRDLRQPDCVHYTLDDGAAVAARAAVAAMQHEWGTPPGGGPEGTTTTSTTLAPTTTTTEPESTTTTSTSTTLPPGQGT